MRFRRHSQCSGEDFARLEEQYEKLKQKWRHTLLLRHDGNWFCVQNDCYSYAVWSTLLLFLQLYVMKYKENWMKYSPFWR